MIQRSLLEITLVGKLLTICGIGILFLWAHYFVELARPTDLWDYCPLPMALLTIVIGIKLAGLNVRLRAKIGISYKRDFAIALAMGSLIEFVLWLLFYLSVTRGLSMERLKWLDSFQDPARTIGLAVWRSLYDRIGSQPGVWIGSICGFLALIVAWSAGVFILLNVFRLANAKAK